MSSEKHSLSLLKYFIFRNKENQVVQNIRYASVYSESNFQRNLSLMAQSYYVQLKIVFSIFDLRDVCVSYSFKTRGKNSITQPE